MRTNNLSDSQWIRRRWLDFRNGHTIYLAFIMTFTIFVVTTYSLAIQQIGFLATIFPSMWMWAVLFLLGYIPAAIIIGHFHRKFQIPTETRQMTDANPFIYYAQPGREKLFSLPAYALGLKSQLHGMMMQNAMAEAIEKIAKDTGASIPVIPRFDQSLFKEYEDAIYISERLAGGEHLLDILEKMKNDGQKNERKQTPNAT